MQAGVTIVTYSSQAAEMTPGEHCRRSCLQQQCCVDEHACMCMLWLSEVALSEAWFVTAASLSQDLPQPAHGEAVC